MKEHGIEILFKVLENGRSMNRRMKLMKMKSSKTKKLLKMKTFTKMKNP